MSWAGAMRWDSSIARRRLTPCSGTASRPARSEREARYARSTGPAAGLYNALPGDGDPAVLVPTRREALPMQNRVFVRFAFLRPLAALVLSGFAGTAVHAALVASENRVVQPVESGSACCVLRAARRVGLACERRRRRACRSAADSSVDHAQALAGAPAGIRSAPEGSAGSRVARLSPLAFGDRDRRAIRRDAARSRRGHRLAALAWSQCRFVSNSRTRIRFSGSATAAVEPRSRPRCATTAPAPRSASRTRPTPRFRRRSPTRSRRSQDCVRALPPALHTSAPIQAAASMQPPSTYCPGRAQPCRTTFSRPISQSIYDLNPLYSQGIKGNGQTIAIVGRSRVYQRRHRRVPVARCPAREHADDDHSAERDRPRPGADDLPGFHAARLRQSDRPGRRPDRGDARRAARQRHRAARVDQARGERTTRTRSTASTSRPTT